MINLVHLLVIFLCVGFYEGKRCTGDIHVPNGYYACGSPNCYCKDNRANCFKVDNANIEIPNHITNLYINCSEITFFTNKTLPNNVNLTNLHIKNSGVTVMKKDAFVNQPFIRSFEVMSCVFHIDREMLFEALASLKHLTQIKMRDFDIYNTSLLNFSPIDVSKVTDLSFKDNQLLEFNATFFSSFTSLRYLDLRNNRINKMSHMATFSYLRNISLQNNRLEISDLNFCMENGTSWFPDLQSLRLASNNIADFPLLRIACLEKLKELDLAENTLRQFNVDNISSFENLQFLSLRDNWLENITPGRFPPALRKLDFGHNGFSGQFPPILCNVNSTEQFPSITDMSFRECSIMKFWIDNWALCLPNIRVLDFGFNLMFKGSNTSVSKLGHLEELNLDANRFKDINEYMFNSSSLKKLSLRYNQIRFDKRENRQLFRNSPNITHLDISSNALGFLHDDQLAEIFSPLQQLTNLTLRSCKFSAIPIAILRNLTNLSNLDLNRNFLTDIYFPKDLITNLTSLSVADNKIQLINDMSFPPQIQKRLTSLNLQWNVFQCGCKLIWFRDQITPDGKFGDIELTYWPYGYYCRDETYKGKLITHFTISKNQCPPFGTSVTTYIVMGCTVFVIAVLGLVLFWNRWYVQLKCLEMKAMFCSKDEADREHRYSGYVISHNEDRDFVNNEFRYKMEDKLGYTLHIWNRNFDAGKAKVDDILDAMDASKAVFVIVSNNLLTWSWGIFQVDVAISRKIEDNRRNIFFVLLEEINRNNLSKSWCVMLTKMPGVPWCNNPDSIKSKLFDQEVKAILGPPPVPMGCIQQSYGAINRIREDIANDSINLEWEEDTREVARNRNPRHVQGRDHIRRTRNATDVAETEPLLGPTRRSIKEESIYTDRKKLLPTAEGKESHKPENSVVNHGGQTVNATIAKPRDHSNKTMQRQPMKHNYSGSFENHEYANTNYIVDETLADKDSSEHQRARSNSDAMNRYVTRGNIDFENNDFSKTNPDIEKGPAGRVEKRSETISDHEGDRRHAVYVEKGKSLDTNRQLDSGFIDM